MPTYYTLNKNTLRLETISTTTKLRLFLLSFLTIILLSAALTGVKSTYLPSPKEKQLQRALDSLSGEYLAYQRDIQMQYELLGEVREREEALYVILFGEYSATEIVDLPQGPIRDRLETIQQQLTNNIESLDRIKELSKGRKDMLASVPSIKPIRMDKVHRSLNLLSGFGMRKHPIHGVYMMHRGIDFVATEGTPIYVTGNGVVSLIQNDRVGYGTHVMVDHGYGYETLYAHLSNYSVEMGEEVKRGQMIAKVGNTGTSTAPHLHYEVRYRGNPVNPIHFVLDGMSPKEYQNLVKLANLQNQSFGK